MFRSNRSQSSHERTAEERERARQERERRRGVDVPETSTPPPVEESGHVDPPTIETPIVEEQLPPVAESTPGAEELSSVAEPLPIAEPPIAEEPPPDGTPPAPLLTGRRPLPALAPRVDSRLTRRVERLRERRAISQRWYRRLGTRLLALLALVGVGVVVWLLVQSPPHKDPPPPPRIVKVTIPEGYTRAQIAELAKADGLTGSYLDASVRSPLLRPTHYGAPASTPSLEGFLFPATYDLYVGQPAQRLVDEQLAAFRANFGGGEISRARSLGVTPYQLLIVASMIEREADVEHDRPLIAAVIYNRLRQGMPLGIDATIRYALNDFSEPLTEAQLHTNSPYNTRLHTGLPPTPISNPGAASIDAAAHPARVSYLYYVAAADGCGRQVFSSSFAQFEHDAAAYREAVAKNHGRVPTCHKK